MASAACCLKEISSFNVPIACNTLLISINKRNHIKRRFAVAGFAFPYPRTPTSHFEKALFGKCWRSCMRAAAIQAGE